MVFAILADIVQGDCGMQATKTEAEDTTAIVGCRSSQVDLVERRRRSVVPQVGGGDITSTSCFEEGGSLAHFKPTSAS